MWRRPVKLPEETGEKTMIDVHAHWKPAEVADALRARTKEPRIVRNARAPRC